MSGAEPARPVWAARGSGVTREAGIGVGRVARPATSPEDMALLHLTGATTGTGHRMPG